ncbi:Sof1 domain-containing U3 snoRNP protein [Hamiltosporidium magnivora]|uniref:Sof1 domain-containing U3 snoRNP protein n=1 Tax=Hamiltosporidium magnivora TaxID=148818 RepID=A0A4Q9LNT9_9MICR|nr:Sof1 domain-containing U3 snoRNP protein [Hamiltosporidium magnivora]TBU09636.1 Sof1 domain-containing U3 snoRNP protein [Hamiltosporidium magnivora]
MKINTITRDYRDTVKERKNDINKRSFTKDSLHHPFSKEREYIRALNATKIERLFAKPFLYALSDHKEGIKGIELHGDSVISYSFDNSAILWSLNEKRKIWTFDMEKTILSADINDRGMCITQGNELFYYSKIKEDESIKKEIKVKHKFSCDGMFNCVKLQEELCCATTNGLEIFDFEKKKSAIQLGKESFHGCFLSNKQPNIILCTFSNEIYLFDKRENKSVGKIENGIKTNEICCNQMRENVFISANEDTNLYLHDLRYLSKPTTTYRNHVNSVLSVDFKPNGEEFISGSYDKTIRIFRTDDCRSRDVYYNQRMQNVYGVRYSECGMFVVSGSDDGSLRVWKSNASHKEGKLTRREKESLKYSEILKEKFSDFPEIKQISKHRFLPKKLRNEMKDTHFHYKADERKKALYEEKRNLKKER